MKILLTSLLLIAAPVAASAQTAAATLPDSFAAQTPAPAAPAVDPARVAAAEAALRAQIAGFQAGAPLYDAMTDGLAQEVRPQEAAVLPIFQSFGALKSVTHVGSENGAEMFLVIFDNAETQWFIGLNSAGKIGALLFRPVPNAA